MQNISDLLQFKPKKVLIITPFGFKQFKNTKQLEKFVSNNVDKTIKTAMLTTKEILVQIEERS